METLVLIPDIQVPQHDGRAVEVALKLIRYIKPTQACFLGDVICCDSVSKYPKSSWHEAALTLKEEIKHTNILLDRFDLEFKESGTKEIYYIEGNHEERLLLWILKNAQSLGDLDSMRIDTQLRLKDRGYKYIPTTEQPLEIGKFNIAHGYYINMYHAAKTMKKTGRNTFYGHAHDWQVHTSDHFRDDNPRISMSCGCLCDFKQSYLHSRPTNWIHGLGIIYYDKDGFTPYFIPIVNYRAIWDGKVFTCGKV